MKYLATIVLGVSLVSCAPTRTLAPGEKTQLKDLAVTIAPRFEELTINCKGIGCAAILYGPREPGPAGLTSAYRKVGPRAFDLVSREAEAQLKSRGIGVRSVGQTPFITLPKPADLLGQSAKVEGSTVLHLQIWDFGISKTGSTDYQPTVSIRAYLVRRETSELLYSQFYNFGAEASGIVINAGSTSTRFRSSPAAAQEPEQLMQGLRSGVQTVIGRIVSDIAQ